MNLLILSDAKKGHENQSLGLAEAISRRIDSQYEIIRIKENKTLQHSPDAIISAGHRTHLPLLAAARKYRCPSIVIMKPTLPCSLFTHCLAPEHDFLKKTKTPQNVFLTKGALNRLPEILPDKKAQGLILLGGSSKHFHWKLERILQAILQIVTAHPDMKWIVGDSRRTPPATLMAIEDLKLPIECVSHQNTSSNWLRDTLLESQVTWLTPDSTSMLFEALTAGCRVGTLPLKRHDTRLTIFQDQLANTNWLTRFDDYDCSIPLPKPPERLHETARCAEHLIPLLSTQP